MKKSGELLIATALVSAAAAVPAAAQTTINFDDGAAATVVGSKYTPLGVTFNGASFTNNFGFAGSSGALGINSTADGFQFGPDDPIIGTFTATASSVSIRGIDVGEAGVRLEAFNASDILLGFDEFFGSGSGAGTFRDLTVSFAGIKSFRVFQPLTSEGENDFDDGVLFDNLSFTTATAGVPEPGSWALMIVGFGAVGYRIRRRQKVTAQVMCTG